MRPIRPQTVTLAVLAILFGLGAAWLAKQVLLAKHEVAVQPAPPPPPRFPLLIMQSNLPADARIRPQDVAQSQETMEKMTQKNVPLGKALRFSQEAVGRVLKHAKLAASWLTEDDFYELGKEPQLKLRAGMRAVNLRIDDPAVSPSIIRTGCLVDVIFTTISPDDGSKLVRRLATGLEVLSPPVSEGGLPNAVETVSPPAGSPKTVPRRSFIVVAATPDDANRLALAQDLEGTISVSLCAEPSDDTEKGDAEKPTPNRVDAIPSRGDYALSVRDLLNLPPRPSPPPPPERKVVEQIRGTDKITYVVFTGDDVRLSQEEVHHNSLPAGIAAGGAAKPAKAKCAKCEAEKKKAIERARREGGGSSPVPETPNPTPAPRST